MSLGRLAAWHGRSLGATVLALAASADYIAARLTREPRQRCLSGAPVPLGPDPTAGTLDPMSGNPGVGRLVRDRICPRDPHVSAPWSAPAPVSRHPHVRRPWRRGDDLRLRGRGWIGGWGCGVGSPPAAAFLRTTRSGRLRVGLRGCRQGAEAVTATSRGRRRGRSPAGGPRARPARAWAPRGRRRRATRAPRTWPSGRSRPSGPWPGRTPRGSRGAARTSARRTARSSAPG
jgi:hypothetical protein